LSIDQAHEKADLRTSRFPVNSGVSQEELRRTLHFSLNQPAEHQGAKSRAVALSLLAKWSGVDGIPPLHRREFIVFGSQ
jgi:hypothetical protein